MKQLMIITGLLALLCSDAFAGYVYTGDSPLRERPLVKKWRFSDGRTTGNFDLFPQSVHITEGWLEVTADNSSPYDPETQTAGDFTFTVFADHAEKARTITNKVLNAYKKEKGRQIRAEGMAILNTKYSDPLEDGYNTDFVTLKAYYKNTIVPLVTNAATLQAVKNINNGDEYTWPSI